MSSWKISRMAGVGGAMNVGAMNGGAEGFVTAASLVNAGAAPVAAPAVATPPAIAVPDGPTEVVAAASGVARTPMRWTSNTSGFVLRRMSQLIESGARADKGFKDKDVNQVAKALREYSREEITTTQVYNHLKK